MSTVDFFKLYRKKGFGETLEVLFGFKKHEAKQSVFFQTLKDNKSYLNSFFRVKEELLKTGLIAYKLDKDNEKVIFLTKKGNELYSKICDIENLITNSS
ncbi:MAG: hypothetical protein GY870_04895 [archaeon]|nr:hypothetical protein [archaeon]